MIPAIQSFLDEKEKAGLLRAMVTEEGEIRCEVPKNQGGKLALQALRQMVLDEWGSGAGTILEMETLEYDAYLRRTGTEKSDKPRTEPKKDSKANRIVEHIINEAISRQASDIFIDIRDSQAFTSFKVYGRTAPDPELEMDDETAETVIRAMWQKGNVDWDPSGPCDVSFTVPLDGDQITRIRGNSLKEKDRGYSIACRLRNPKEIIPLNKAGYLHAQLQALERMVKAPGGLIIIAGPTGSGKSTTLTAMVESMPRSIRKIEVADPVEIYLDHCTHVTITGRVDGSYENLDLILGATVRQNPDVLILGEIRDRRSAMAAMGMTQQGKRVLSSLHANNCGGVPPRLNDLGLDLNLLGFREFFVGCASQNLVALLCRNCAREADKTNEDECRLLDLLGPGIRFTGEGCKECSNGTVGQTVVAQVYPLIDDPGPAYEMIRRSDFARLDTYMAKEHNVKSKHAAATLLARRGKVDPLDIEDRIGRYPAEAVDGKEELVEAA